jgi:hypothetical protein
MSSSVVLVERITQTSELFFQLNKELINQKHVPTFRIPALQILVRWEVKYAKGKSREKSFLAPSLNNQNTLVYRISVEISSPCLNLFLNASNPFSSSSFIKPTVDSQQSNYDSKEKITIITKTTLL